MRFLYYYQGRGIYKVFRRLSGRDVYIGEIETIAPVAFSRNPGKWRARPPAQLVDSMDEAALELFQTAQEQLKEAA
jgi:hypothetical protein